MRAFGSGALAICAFLLVAAAPPSTAEQNKAEMMRQLGITRLIPGASGDPASGRSANYDEAKATPFPVLPDPLTFRNGRKVTNAAEWPRRRAEIAEDYAREVYGRVPDGIPLVEWTVTATDHERMGMFTPVLARQVIGRVPHPSDPARDVKIRMMVVLPEGAKGPVPVLIMFGRADFPAPSYPEPAELDRINAATKALLVKQDPALGPVFDRHQALNVFTPPPFRMPERDRFGDLPREAQLVAAGWGYALLDTASIQADDGAGLRDGIIGLANDGGPRTPDQWGALRAWGWGASRALDWLATDPRVDAKRVGIEGVSRYGKAALVAMAFDQRFALGLIGSSGKGGTTLLRRNFGETVGNLADGAFHWMAGNFMKYDTKGVSPPNLDASALPVDANALIALAAPRPVFISYGIPEEGDAHWLDHKGSYLAALDAGRVYRLLGKDGVGVTGPATMPPPEQMIDGTLAWRQHVGGHTDQPNFRHFIPWANKQLAIAP
jgi:hypothetical protein